MTTIPPSEPESSAQLTGRIGSEIQAQAKKVFSDLIGATVGVLSLNLALKTSGKTQSLALKTYVQSMAWRESLMKKEGISLKQALSLKPETHIKNNIAKLAGNVAQDIKARFDCARQAIKKNKSVIQGAPQRERDEAVAETPRHSQHDKPLPATPKPKQQHLPPDRPLPATPKPKLVPDSPAAPRSPVGDFPQPMALQAPPAEAKPSLDKTCDEALQKAKKIPIKNHREFIASLNDLITFMRGAAGASGKYDDPATTALRYFTTAQFLMHVAENHMNSDTPLMRETIMKSVDSIEANCVLKNVRLSPEQTQFLNAIRDKVAIRESTEPKITTPLPGDEEPKDQDVMQSIGLRTRAMGTLLDRLTAFNGSALQVKNQQFVPLTGKVTDFITQPSASIGSSTGREIVTLDPANSPLLNQHYEALEQLILEASQKKGATLSPQEMLILVNTHVREEIFPTCNDPNLERQVDAFVNSKRETQDKVETRGRDKKEIPVIPIDDFIAAKTGVCRHHAMVTAYLLDRLTKEHGGKEVPKGTVRHVRDNLDAGGAHVWVNFICDAGKFHLDTLWNVVTPFNQPGEQRRLQRMYGQNVMANQERRANRVVAELKR